MVRQQTKKKLALTLLLSAISDHLLEAVPPPRLICGSLMERARMNPSFGLGYGAPGRKRVRRPSSIGRDIVRWSHIDRLDDSYRLKQLVHMTTSEFRMMLADMEEACLDRKLRMSSVSINRAHFFQDNFSPNSVLGTKFCFSLCGWFSIPTFLF